MYTKKALKHFNHPRNYGKIKNPDGAGKVGNLMCGDVMWLYIKIGKDKKKKEIIKDIKFETFGCVAAIATSSVTTELAKGKTIEDAMKISKGDIVDSLEGLPPIKLHCSVLAIDALAEAIYDYLLKNKKEIPPELKERHKRISQEERIVKEKFRLTA